MLRNLLRLARGGLRKAEVCWWGWCIRIPAGTCALSHPPPPLPVLFFFSERGAQFDGFRLTSGTCTFGRYRSTKSSREEELSCVLCAPKTRSIPAISGQRSSSSTSEIKPDGSTNVVFQDVGGRRSVCGRAVRSSLNGDVNCYGGHFTHLATAACFVDPARKVQCGSLVFVLVKSLMVHLLMEWIPQALQTLVSTPPPPRHPPVRGMFL